MMRARRVGAESSTPIWYRGGSTSATEPNWFTKSRAYAAFYGDEIHTLNPNGELLDLSDIGVDIDTDVLAANDFPTPRTSSGEMYEWAERSWQALRDKGYSGVIVKQWHADFDDKSYTSLLYWGHLAHEKSRPSARESISTALAVGDRIVIVKGCKPCGLDKGVTARVADVTPLGAEYGHNVKVVLNPLNGFKAGRRMAFYARHVNRLSDPIVRMNDGNPSHTIEVQRRNR